MNERIRQLAEQAGIKLPNNVAEGVNGLGVVSEQERLAKFAQLIVRECAGIAREIGNNTEPDDFALDRCYEIEDQIMKHFGVEE